MKDPRAALISLALIVSVLAVGWFFSRPMLDGGGSLTKENAIRNNLRMLVTAADRYCAEHRTDRVSLDQIVGLDKLVVALISVDGEDYSKLDLSRSTTSWTVTSASGVSVTHRR